MTISAVPVAARAATEYDLVCIGQEDWDDVWRRNQFLLSGLARRGIVRKTLFVDRPCDITHALRKLSSSATRHLQWTKLTQAVRGPCRSDDAPNLWLLTPFKLFPNSVPALRRLNEQLERLQVAVAMRRLHIQPAIFWTQNPEAAHWLDVPSFAMRVYDATDDWSLVDSPRAWVDLVTCGQERLARDSDLVLACSPALFEKWQRSNLSTHFVPNAVDVAHFGPSRQQAPPPDITQVQRPVLGYTGTLHDGRINVELVYRVASARPQWQLVFIGPDFLKAESRAYLRSLPNVHLLGPRPYGLLPAYMGAFNVCILPHLVTPFTESLNPIKIYEFLATGLPIVSTPVATVRDFGDVVSLARTDDEFVAALESALAEHDPALERRRRALAEENSWEMRIDVVERTMREGLEAGSHSATVAAATGSVVE